MINSNNILFDIKKVLVAALTNKQKQLVDELLKENGRTLDERYEKLFNGKDRIYLPNIIEVENREMSDTSRNNIYLIGILINLWFRFLGKVIILDRITYEDYIRGKVFVDGREQNIGKILNNLKLNREKICSRIDMPDYNFMNQFNIEDVIAEFNNRPTAKASNKEYIVVISKDPYDIAGMSTDRRWTSCMKLKDDGTESTAKPSRAKNFSRGGCYRYYVSRDLSEGTLIAYLIDKDDRDIDDPFARVLIKPYVNKSRTKIYLTPEDKVYKDSKFIYDEDANKFLKVVNEWAEKNQQDIKGKFYPNYKLYPDSGSKTITKMDKNVKLEHLIYESIEWNSIFPMGDFNIYKHVVTSSYIIEVNQFIEKWNKYIAFKIRPIFGCSLKIKTNEMTGDDYTNLDFPIDISTDDIIKVSNHHPEISIGNKISIDEIIKILNHEKVMTRSNVGYDAKASLSIIEMMKTKNRTDVEAYDLIVTRKDINTNNFVEVDHNDYLNARSGITNDYNIIESFPLYTVYLVSSGQTDIKQAKLLKLVLDLVIDVDTIETSEDVEYLLDNGNFMDDDTSLFSYYLKYFGLDAEFIEYLNEDNNLKIAERLSNNVPTALNNLLNLATVDVENIMDNYDFHYDQSAFGDGDYERQDIEDEAKQQLFKLEKKIFDDVDIDENDIDYEKVNYAFEYND